MAHGLEDIQRGFRRWMNDPDSRVDVREGSRLYTSHMWRKGSRIETTDTPYQDMVEDMREHFEAHPEDLPVISDDNLASRRCRFSTQDKSRSWELGLHDSLQQDLRLMGSPESREALARKWSEEWKDES